MPRTRPYLVVLWFIGLVSIPMSMVPAQVFNYLTGVLQGPRLPGFSAIWPIILLYLLCRAGIAFLDMVRTMVTGEYLEESVRGYTMSVFSRMLRVSPDFFRRHDPARIANRVLSDTRAVQSFWLSLLVNVPVSVLGLFAYAYVLFFGLSAETPVVGAFLGTHTQHGSWLLGGLILFLAPIQSYFVLFDKKIQSMNREAALAGDRLVSAAHETVAGVSEIRGHDAFDYAMDRVGKAFEGFKESRVRVSRLSAFFKGAGPMINALVNCILLAIGARLCIGAVRVEAVGLSISAIRWQDYLGFAFMAMTVHAYIGSLMRFYLRWRMTRETIRRVDEYAKAPLVFFPDPEALEAEAAGGISFEDVEVTTALKNRILSDLAVMIPSGGRVGFAGPSGSGKSTALNLVVREIEPTSGTLKVGGVPIQEVNHPSLAREVAMVPQKPVLFDMSIRDNILLSLRRPGQRQVKDTGWAVDASRLPGIEKPEDMDRLLLRVTGDVALVQDLVKKALDHPFPRNRLETSPLARDVRALSREITQALSRTPDKVVFFDRAAYFEEGTLLENLLFGRPVNGRQANLGPSPMVERIHELLAGSHLTGRLLDLGRWRFMRDRNAGRLVQLQSPRLFALLTRLSRMGLDPSHMADALHSDKWEEVKASLKQEHKLVLLEVALETSAAVAASFFFGDEDFILRVLLAREAVVADPKVRSLGVAPFGPGGLEAGLSLRDALVNGRPNSRVRGAAEHVDQVVEAVLAEYGLTGELVLAGLESPAGPGGRNLSGGQMMKVCLARALVKQPSVYLLDEVTGPLDERSQAKVLSTIRKLPPESTVVMVSHRMAAISQCDRIMVFDRGRVVQEGTYEKLCSEPGLFRTLAVGGQAHGPESAGPEATAVPVEEKGAAAISDQSAQLRRAIALSPTFAGLDASQIALLEHLAKPTGVSAQTLLFSRGDEGHEMFIILEGQVEFFLEKEVDGEMEKEVIDTFGPGQAFGEMALFGEMPRTLSARALTDTRLCVITRQDLLELVQESPDVAVRLLHTICRRLAHLMDRVN
ncbi:MAG: ATP-binding cassette domain-containing protein [Deltaproteobacteria bacterium]|nr:ATP-binding cassette domain-containing protein [Deltaproteobacteria bacterium]